jgi:hypothetical protein
MIGFIAHAGMAVQGNVMMLLPNEVSVPPLPYAKELTDEFNQLKADPSMAEKLGGIDIPDLTAMETIKFDMTSNTGNFELPEEMINHLQASDVTTITDTSKEMADNMFMQMTPSIISNITGGIDSGINGINDSISEMTKAIDKMQAMPSMKKTVDQMNNAKLMMSGTVEKMSTLKEALPGIFDTAKTNYLSDIEIKRNVIENEFQATLNNGFKQVYSTVAIASLLAMIVLMFYREDRKNKVNMPK